MDLSSVFDDELVDVELSLASRVVHEPDLAKDCPLTPALETNNLFVILSLLSRVETVN